LKNGNKDRIVLAAMMIEMANYRLQIYIVETIAVLT
jgi:hypothetical protein